VVNVALLADERLLEVVAPLLVLPQAAAADVGSLWCRILHQMSTSDHLAHLAAMSAAGERATLRRVATAPTTHAGVALMHAAAALCRQAALQLYRS
jgi:hypothetical protein